MPVTAPRGNPALAAATRAEIDRVRDSGVLGRSGRLFELFEFLAARSDGDPAPKEIEIALSVFGKGGVEAAKDDPVARVYVHRLRRRLDEFYLRNGSPSGVRVAVPKGEYRIVGQPIDEGSMTPAPRRVGAFGFLWSRPRLVAVVAAAALLIGNVAAWAVVTGGRGGEVEQLRRDPVWAALSGQDRPLMIVVGDYYMFGEYQGGMFLNRLVRDFAINSREDLLEALRGAEPEDAEVYSDVNVRYLPVSIAFALTRILRVLPPERDVRVVLASEVSADTIRDFDIIYVGLISGLAALREPAFAASRFAVGTTYDELIDTETGERYVSEAFMSAPYGTMHRDYGFAAGFPGPRGTRILIVAGARDAAVMGVAESLTRPGALRELHAGAGAGAFEALYEVQGQQHVSLESDLLAAAARDGARIWATPETPLTFPRE
jgi:hypothetical protein